MDTILKDLQTKLAGILSALTQEVGGVRTSRPSPALVEDLKIEYYGQMVPIKQLGSISIVPPREMVISLWDPAGVSHVAKAIDEAKRGFSASTRGNAIHLNLPPLSQERREELVKLLKSFTEAARIQIRNGRDEANKKGEIAEKAKTISEDQKFNLKKKVQEAVDKTNKDIDALLEKKTKEINE